MYVQTLERLFGSGSGRVRHDAGSSRSVRYHPAGVYCLVKINKNPMKNKKNEAKSMRHLAILTIPLAILTAGLALQNPDNGQNLATAAIVIPKRENVPAEAEKAQDAPMWRTVTAYNPVPGQTDGDPCRSANGTDICAGMARGEHYVATNELPFGTKVQISGEIYTVVDRTNSRYAYRYDIAFPADQIEKAIEFGKKTLQVEIIK